MTPEYLEMAWKVACIVFFAGMFWAELKAIRKDIARLEKKADESNHLKERVSVLETKMQDIAKECVWGGKDLKI